jgi:hypothetical protein
LEPDENDRQVYIFLFITCALHPVRWGSISMIVNRALMMQESRVEDLGKEELEIDWDSMEMEMDEELDLD